MTRSPARSTVPLVVAGATALLALLVVLRGLDALDEGTILHLADRLRVGEVLYRDLVTGVAPAFYYLVALLFGLFGPHLLVGRLLMAALLVAATLLVYALVRRWTTPAWAATTGLLFAAWQALHWRLPSYSGAAVVAILAAVWLLLEAQRRDSIGHLAAAAACVGLAGATKQSFGLLALLALGAVLLLDLGVRRRASLPGRRPLPALAATAAGVTLPLGLFLLYFLAVGALDDFFRWAVLAPLTTTADYFRIPYPPLLAPAEPVSAYTPLWDLYNWLSQRAAGLGDPLNQAAIRIHYGFPLLGLGAAAGWAAGRLRRRDRPHHERLAPATLAIFAGFLFLGVFPRCDSFHLVLAATLVQPVTSLALHAAVERAGPGRRRAAMAVVGLLATLWIAGPVAGLVSWTAHPDPSYRHSHWLDLPRASTWVRETVGPDIEDAVPLLVARAEEGGFTTMPTLPLYHFLTGTPNPLRFPLILPGALDEAEVIAGLDRLRVPWIVYRDETIDEGTVRRDLPRLYRYLRRHYRLDPHSPVLHREQGILLLERHPAATRTSAELRGSFGLLDHLELARHEIVSLDGTVRTAPTPGPAGREDWLFREILLQVPPAGAAKLVTRFSLELPAAPVELVVDIGLRPDTWVEGQGDGVLFEVFAAATDGSGATERLLARYVDPKARPADRRLFRERASLRSWAGRRVSLALVTSGGPRLNQGVGQVRLTWDWAGWAEPALVAPGGRKPPAVTVLPAAAPPPAATARAIVEIDRRPFVDELARHPGDPDVLWAWARVEAWSGDDRRALPLLLRAMEAGIESAEAYRLAVTAALRLDERELLAELLERGLELHPELTQLRVHRGGLRLAAGDPEGAADDFQRALLAEPRSYWAQFGMARALMAVDDCAGARERALRARHLKAEQPGAPLVLGHCAQRVGEPAVAAAWYRRSARVPPALQKPEPFLHWGFALLADGRRGEALEAWCEGLDRFPDHPRLAELVAAEQRRASGDPDGRPGSRAEPADDGAGDPRSRHQGPGLSPDRGLGR